MAVTLRQLTDSAQRKLAALYGDGEARWLIRLVMEHEKGWNQVELVIRANQEVSDFIVGRVNEVVDRLIAGEPIQYIYGDTYWYGMTLSVNPSVLIPRPETEELVDIIVKAHDDSDLKVLDVCTGSGCIAVALAKTLKFPEVTAIDISADALDVACQNAAGQKVAVDFVGRDALLLASDTVATNASKYDIIVSNPPYVMDSEKSAMERNVIDHEPHIALFVPDSDSLKFYKAIATYAETALTARGRLYFELNPLTADELRSWMISKGWDDVRIIPDIHARKRFLVASR